MMEAFTTMVEVLALLFIIFTPIVLFVWILNRFWTRWLPTYMEKRERKYCPSPLKAMWTSTETTTTTEEKTPVIDCQKIVDVGTRVWRVYQSDIAGVNWAELDPALTERAACNYASYIKRLNPDSFIRVNNPEGIIISYE